MSDKFINLRDFLKMASNLKPILMGFKSVDGAIGKCDYDVPSKISELASTFITNDKKTMDTNTFTKYCDVLKSSDS